MRYSKYHDRETLERIKRWPKLMSRFEFVRIYSAEWESFWRGKGNGYTPDPLESKVWKAKEAFERTQHCGPEKRIQFVAVNNVGS